MNCPHGWQARSPAPGERRRLLAWTAQRRLLDQTANGEYTGVAALQYSRKTAKNTMRMVKQYYSPPSPVFIWGYSRTHSILDAARRWIRNGAVSTPFLFRQNTQPITALPLPLSHLPLALAYARAAIVS